MKRSFYLKSTDLEIAKANYNHALEDIYLDRKIEIVESRSALNRVLSQPIYANRSVPFYPSSAMDGIALNYKFTYN